MAVDCTLVSGNTIAPYGCAIGGYATSAGKPLPVGMDSPLSLGFMVLTCISHQRAARDTGWMRKGRFGLKVLLFGSSR
jgi:hypothetical protein